MNKKILIKILISAFILMILGVVLYYFCVNDKLNGAVQLYSVNIKKVPSYEQINGENIGFTCTGLYYDENEQLFYVGNIGKYKPEENIIVGNVALYGATSGEAYINGIAGERFCVRNSGAYAVVEGVGEHGCEYMTGGRVVVLGATGKNFAAGMSGGIAYVLDEKSNLYRNLNKEMISIEPVESKYDIAELKNMIEKHVAHTGSEKGKEILTHFDEYLPKFKKIIPNDYKRMMMLSAQMEDKGLSSEQAQIEAFYESMRK